MMYANLSNVVGADIPFRKCVNTEATAIPPGGVGEIIGVSGTSSLNFDGAYRVKKPSQDSFGPLLFFPGGLPASATGTGLIGYEPVGVAYDPTSGDPDVGDEIGCKSGSYLLHVGQTGYECLAVDTANEIAYVRHL